MLFLSLWGLSWSWHGYFQHQQLYSFTLHSRCINFTSTLTSITWRLPMRKKQIQTTMMYKWFRCVKNGFSIFNNALEKELFLFAIGKNLYGSNRYFPMKKQNLVDFKLYLIESWNRPFMFIDFSSYLYDVSNNNQNLNWYPKYLYCSIWCLRIYPFQLLSGKQNVRKPLIEELTNGPRNSIPSQKVT